MPPSSRYVAKSRPTARECAPASSITSCTQTTLLTWPSSSISASPIMRLRRKTGSPGTARKVVGHLRLVSADYDAAALLAIELVHKARRAMVLAFDDGVVRVMGLRGGLRRLLPPREHLVEESRLGLLGFPRNGVPRLRRVGRLRTRALVPHLHLLVGVVELVQNHASGQRTGEDDREKGRQSDAEAKAHTGLFGRSPTRPEELPGPYSESRKRGSRFSRFAFTASAWFGLPSSDPWRDCSRRSPSSVAEAKAPLKRRLAARM